MSESSTVQKPLDTQKSPEQPLVAYTLGQADLVAKATEKKLANAKAQEDGAKREARTLVYICKHTDLPFVAFNQGFASGESGFVEGMPHEKGIEPALSDLRLERVYQERPAHVHIEVSGTSFTVGAKDHLYIKLEKLRQQQRTGDEKLFMLVLDKFRDENGRIAPKAVPLAIPKEAFDLSGNVRARYNDPNGLHVRTVAGQEMLALPHDTPYRLTKDQFIERVEKALNRPHFDRLDDTRKQADRDFHAGVQQDEKRMTAMNQQYIKERGALTMPGNQVVVLNQTNQERLNKIGALNAPDVVADYRKAIGWPPRERSKDIER